MVIWGHKSVDKILKVFNSVLSDLDALQVDYQNDNAVDKSRIIELQNKIAFKESELTRIETIRRNLKGLLGDDA